jgi:hypothetical protein
VRDTTTPELSQKRGTPDRTAWQSAVVDAVSDQRADRAVATAPTATSLGARDGDDLDAGHPDNKVVGHAVVVTDLRGVGLQGRRAMAHDLGLDSHTRGIA